MIAAPIFTVFWSLAAKDGGTAKHHGPNCADEPGCESPDNNHYATPLTRDALIAAQTAEELAREFGFELQDKASAQIAVEVRTEPGGMLSYHYTVHNSTASSQRIHTVAIQADVSVTTNNVVPPPG